MEKRDAATGEVIPVAGAKFQMVNEKTGEEVRYKIYYPTEQWLCEFETDDSGTLTLPGPLGYGRYLLYEKKAPDGYILNENPVQFSVETDIESPIVVSFFDQDGEREIEVVKTGRSFRIPMWRKQTTGYCTTQSMKKGIGRSLI
ncbi:MAG: collagen binding domain-containing protein [Clostridia bacterium]